MKHSPPKQKKNSFLYEFVMGGLTGQNRNLFVRSFVSINEDEPILELGVYGPDGKLLPIKNYPQLYKAARRLIYSKIKQINLTPQ